MNGGSCCLLKVCCPAPEQQHELAKAIGEHLQDDPAIAVVSAGDDLPNGTVKSIVTWLLDHFDLVPKGVGEAIVEGYGPYFKTFKRADGNGAAATSAAEAGHEK